jgi:hypothetical protein
LAHEEGLRVSWLEVLLEMDVVTYWEMGLYWEATMEERLD